MGALSCWLLSYASSDWPSDLARIGLLRRLFRRMHAGFDSQRLTSAPVTRTVTSTHKSADASVTVSSVSDWPALRFPS
jgi:hypothetical protein